MGAFAEEMQIELAEDRTEPVGVVDLLRLAVFDDTFEVGAGEGHRHFRTEKTRFVQTSERDLLARLRVEHQDRLDIGQERAHGGAVPRPLQSQHRVRVLMLAAHDGFDIGPTRLPALARGAVVGSLRGSRHVDPFRSVEARSLAINLEKERAGP